MNIEEMDYEELNNLPSVGSWQAIKHELKEGNLFTVIDEVWHSKLLERFLPKVHFEYCNWVWEKYWRDKDIAELDNEPW